MKQYFLELYFRKDGQVVFDEQPKLDEYSKRTISEVVTSDDWTLVKNTIKTKYPEVAYIQLHDIKDISI